MPLSWMIAPHCETPAVHEPALLLPGGSSGCQVHSCTVKLAPPALAVNVTESPASTVLGTAVSSSVLATGVTVIAKLPV